jgi:UDP-glucose 4-epimerase
VSAVQHNEGELVLVTGGAGFIGSHTVDRLVVEGCRVVVVDDFSSGKPENLAHWSNDPRVEIITASIANGIFAPLAAVTKRHGPIERIVHLAAQVSVTQSIQDPLDDVRINYAGTVHVLEYARCSGVKKVVFASSSAVYGDNIDLPVLESAKQSPVSPYGVDKLGAELFLNYYCAVHGVPTTALRFFNVYGPRQDASSPYSGVISIFATRAIAGDTLNIYGDGEQTRDFIFVGDVARAVVTACLSKTTDGAIINIGTGREITINELAHEIIALCQSPSAIAYRAARPGDILRSVASTERAAQLLGFRSAVALRDGLRQTLNWLRNPVAS